MKEKESPDVSVSTGADGAESPPLLRWGRCPTCRAFQAIGDTSQTIGRHDDGKAGICGGSSQPAKEIVVSARRPRKRQSSPATNPPTAPPDQMQVRAAVPAGGDTEHAVTGSAHQKQSTPAPQYLIEARREVRQTRVPLTCDECGVATCFERDSGRLSPHVLPDTRIRCRLSGKVLSSGQQLRAIRRFLDAAAKPDVTVLPQVRQRVVREPPAIPVGGIRIFYGGAPGLGRRR